MEPEGYESRKLNNTPDAAKATASKEWTNLGELRRLLDFCFDGGFGIREDSAKWISDACNERSALLAERDRLKDALTRLLRAVEYVKADVTDFPAESAQAPDALGRT